MLVQYDYVVYHRTCNRIFIMKEFDWGPVIGTVIAIAGMLFALVLGYIIGYSDAKEGK